MSGNPVRVKIETDSSKLQSDISKSVKKLQEMSKQYEDIQNKLKSRTPEEFARTLEKALEKNNAALDKEKKKLEELEETYNNRANKIREMRDKGASENAINKEYEKQQNTQNRMDQSTDRINKLEQENFEITQKTTKQWELQNSALRQQGEELKNNFNILEAIMNQDIKDQKGSKIKEFFIGAGDKVKGMFGKASGMFDSKTLKQATSGLESMSKYAGRMMFSLLGAQTVFSLISKAVNQIKQDNKELANTINTLWNGIVAFIEPVVNGIVKMLATALNYVIKMISVIGGTSVLKFLNKANKKANSRKGGGDSSNLYSFDTSETIQKNGAGGTSLEDSYLKDIELNEKLLELAMKIKAFWEKIKEITIDWWKSIDFQPLMDAFENLWDSVMPILDDLGNIILWLYEHILLPFLGWLIEDIIPDLMNILAPALDIIHNIFQTLAPLLETLWNDVLSPMLETIREFTHTVFEKIAEGLERIARDMDDTSTTVGRLYEDIKTILNGIVEFIAGVFTGDWERAWNGVKDIFGGIWNAILDTFETVINAMIKGINWLIDKLNTIYFDAPGWVTALTGVTGWGISLNKVSEISLQSYKYVPKLAKGAVIPPNNEFLAMLGDQTRGRNIETPEELLREIVQEESGTGEINIVANGSMSQLIKLLRLELQKEDKRVGNSLVVGG